MGTSIPPGVRNYGQKPPRSGSKPAPPDGFGQKPGGGSEARGSDPSAEATERGSVSGMPSGVMKHSPTDNMQSQMAKGPTSKSVTGSPKESMPAGVDKGFRQTP